MTRQPLSVLTVLVLAGSLAFAQAPPPPAAAPAPQAAPAPSGPGRGMRPNMRPGMQGRPGMYGGGMQGRGNGQGDFRRAGAMHRPGGGFHGRSGESFRGAEGGLGAGLRIAPPGMWWKNPGIVQKLTLTPEQTKKMDDIFQLSRLDLIDKKAAVEKANAMLEPLLSANPVDTTKALAQIDKVARARADLEMANAKMLLSIRGVLTPDQWTKLHSPPTRPQGAAAPGGPPQGGGGGGYGPGGGYGGGRGPHGYGGQGTGSNFVAPNTQP